jgi:hypothetical protein
MQANELLEYELKQSELLEARNRPQNQISA